jgi:outer membrane protein TolC
LQIVQPLLSGFGAGASGDLQSARRDRAAAEARYADAVLTTAALVEQTYWDLYAAERDLAVQLLIRDQTASFLGETRLRAEAGLVGPNQVANARVFLAEQEQAVLDREENLDRISDQLATLIGERPSGANFRYHPQDEPTVRIAAPQVDSLLARAIAANRSLEAAANAVAAAKLRERSARWNALPQLDLVGSIGGNGLSGTGRDVVVIGDTVRSLYDGSGGDALSSALKRENPSWTVGVRLTYPIGLRSGGGERDRLAGERARAEEQYEAVRRAIEEDVRRAYRELSHAQRRLEVARDGVDASLEQVRIGRLEYDAGRTTAFELVRLAADLASAQQRYSQALVRAAKAAAEIKRLTTATIAGNFAG